MLSYVFDIFDFLKIFFERPDRGSAWEDMDRLEDPAPIAMPPPLAVLSIALSSGTAENSALPSGLLAGLQVR